MDCYDAIAEILDKAASVRLPGHKVDVVTAAGREFAKRGCCDAKFIDPIEGILRGCLRRWPWEQKRSIWLSTETGAQSDTDFDAIAPSSIEMELEGELMYHLINELSSRDRRTEPGPDDWHETNS